MQRMLSYLQSTQGFMQIRHPATKVNKKNCGYMRKPKTLPKYISVLSNKHLKNEKLKTGNNQNVKCSY